MRPNPYAGASSCGDYDLRVRAVAQRKHQNCDPLSRPPEAGGTPISDRVAKRAIASAATVGTVTAVTPPAAIRRS
jgi:hypothetical protein